MLHAFCKARRDGNGMILNGFFCKNIKIINKVTCTPWRTRDTAASRTSPSRWGTCRDQRSSSAEIKDQRIVGPSSVSNVIHKIIMHSMSIVNPFCITLSKQIPVQARYADTWRTHERMRNDMQYLGGQATYHFRMYE